MGHALTKQMPLRIVKLVPVSRKNMFQRKIT